MPLDVAGTIFVEYHWADHGCHISIEHIENVTGEIGRLGERGKQIFKPLFMGRGQGKRNTEIGDFVLFRNRYAYSVQCAAKSTQINDHIVIRIE